MALTPTGSWSAWRIWGDEVEECVDAHTFSEILDHVDLVLYDIKAVDEEKHARLTGKSNRVIVKNLELAVAKGANVMVRIPVVPNVNVSRNEFSRFAELIAGLGIKEVELLPYHKLGIAKYRLLRRPYQLDAEPPTAEFLDDFKSVLSSRGILVTVGGSPPSLKR